MTTIWRTKTLDEVCKKITDGAHNSPKTVKSGKPMVSVKDLTRFGPELSTARHISENDYEKLVKQGCKPEVDDVLIAKDGNSALDTVCNIKMPLDIVLLSSVAILRPNKDRIDSDFLKYFLSSETTKSYLKSNFISGAAIPRVVLKDFRKVQIKLPPIDIQKDIASILNSLEDRIEILQKTNTTLESIAQALFKSWFVDFDPVRAKAEGREPEGLDPEIAAFFPDSLEGSELGSVPYGWRVGSLSLLMDIAGGTQPPANQFLDTPKEGYIRLIQIRDYETESHLTFIPESFNPRRTTKQDIMIARYGASVGRICWGLDGAYNVALVKVVCDSNNREFLRTYLQSNIFQSRLAALSGRSAQAGFNKDDISSFKLAIPTTELLNMYEQTASPLREKILQNRESIKNLSTIRDTILPRLISGQLQLTNCALVRA